MVGYRLTAQDLAAVRSELDAGGTQQDQERLAEIERRLAGRVPRLSVLCRGAVVRAVPLSYRPAVTQLPLPSRMKEFLLFDDLPLL